MLITEFGATIDISEKDYGITSGARSILGYDSSGLVKTKKKITKKTFQTLKKIFALGGKKKQNKNKQMKTKTKIKMNSF